MRNVQFKGNEIWYIQSDSLAKAASLAVILANAWIKLFEASLQKPEFIENISKSNEIGNRSESNQRGTFRGKGIEYA